MSHAIRIAFQNSLHVLTAAILSLVSVAFPTTESACSAAGEPIVDVRPTDPQAVPLKVKAAGGATAARIAERISSFPLSFEVNKGQTAADVKFFSRGRGYALFLSPREAVISLARESKNVRKPSLPPPQKGRNPAPGRSGGDTLRMRLVGANSSPEFVGLNELPGRSHYFIGNDPAKWRTNIPNYARVMVADVYPGIDLVYYGNQRRLEHDWIVAPGADPRLIRLRFISEGKVRLDSQGDLMLDSSGHIQMRAPRIYQERDGVRTEISGGYVFKGGHEIGFRVGHYDTTLPLVIDPVILYSTYLGGSSGDSGLGIAVDAAGNAYVTGSTSSVDFPVENPFQGSYRPGDYSDAFVSKFSASGSSLVYSTYLGGLGQDIAQGIALDSSGNAYVTGSTISADFPTVNPFQATLKGISNTDAFVAKLNPSGNQLLYSTYLGGFLQDAGNAIAVDSSGNAYVAGYTDSIDFPTSKPFKANYSGYRDAFVAKLNPSGNTLAYSTYLGGSNTDDAEGIAVDSSGSAYLTGLTLSIDFPTVKPLQAKYGGSLTGGDAFVTKLAPAGNALIYSTYLGGSLADEGTAIAVDSSGSAYVAGFTNSIDFPTSNPFQEGYGGYTDAFVAKISSAGDALVYSTYLGGSDEDKAMGIAVDASGSAHVTGGTFSLDFPTADPFQANLRAAAYADAFVTKLNPSGKAPVYSTYLGGTFQDVGDGIAVDSSGNAYVTGETTSFDFPVQDPFQATKTGVATSAFVAKISGLKSSLTFTLPGGGASAASTAGSAGPAQVGYAAATVTSGVVPYGVAVFSFRQNDIVVSEAAVPASPPTTSARIFVDYRTDVPAMPGRSDAGSVDIDTGVAVVNLGSAAANVTYTLHDSTGAPISTGHGSIAPGTHFAKFVDQLKDVAPDFSVPADFSTAIQFGTLDVTANQPLSVLALRLTMNQRHEALLTTTPVADLTQSPGTLPLYFPQLADGGGYSTTVILLSTSGGIETGKLALFDDNGGPLVVNQLGGTRDSVFSYSIKPGGAFVFQTDGSPATAAVGSVQLTPDTNTLSPVGAGVFSFLQRGIRVTESGVPAATPTGHARIYIDQSAGHGTGLAVANPGGKEISATLRAYQTDGVTPAGNSTDPVTLKANGHTARFVSQLISGLPADFTGVLDISSSSPFVALTLRSLTNSRSDFLLTTFPTADVNRPAPSPIIFPQIADGGGYSTEFILLSAGGPAAATISFYGEDGTPLAVGK